jgi:Zn ribbon nucleic-acid-binding protein
MASDHQRAIWRKATQRYKEKHQERVRGQKTKYRLSHSESCLIAVRKTRQRYIAEGRCPSCSNPLIAGEKKYCVNCGNTAKGEFTYAKSVSRYSKELRNTGW